jgi:hypothetical protein
MAMAVNVRFFAIIRNDCRISAIRDSMNYYYGASSGEVPRSAGHSLTGSGNCYRQWLVGQQQLPAAQCDRFEPFVPNQCTQSRE